MGLKSLGSKTRTDGPMTLGRRKVSPQSPWDRVMFTEYRKRPQAMSTGKGPEEHLNGAEGARAGPWEA